MVSVSGQTPSFLLGSEQPLTSFIDVRRVFLFQILTDIRLFIIKSN